MLVCCDRCPACSVDARGRLAGRSTGRWLPRSLTGACWQPRSPFVSPWRSLVVQRDLRRERSAFKSRRKGALVGGGCRGDDITARRAHTGPSSSLSPPSFSFFSFLFFFPSRGYCGGGLPCVLLLISGAIIVVVCCPASSAGARNPVAPHSQGGLMPVADHTQGVQPSYSSAKFSRRVASLMM